LESGAGSREPILVLSNRLPWDRYDCHMTSDYDQLLVKVRVENLRALLAARGMSQLDLAHSVGVTQATVSHYLTGRAELRRHFCKKVELAYGLPMGSMDHKGLTIPPAPIPSANLRQVNLEGLSPIQLAVLDAFSKAARTGALDDLACAELIGRFVSIQGAHLGQARSR
jgi:transcriptional regulator with XRE-family HTH domain